MNRVNVLLGLFGFAIAGASCTEAERGAKDEPGVAAPTGEPSAPLAVAEAPRTTPKRHVVPIEGLPSYGPADAPVTIVEATDYDCPYCARAEATMRTLRDEHPRDVRVVVLPVPLPMHPRAEPAALASLTVFAAKPAAFAEVHAALFADQRAHEDAQLAALVARAGADDTRARAAAEGTLARAGAVASALHVTGTPTFFVNGRILRGAQPIAAFRALVDDEIARAAELEASGVARGAIYETLQREAREHPAALDDVRDEPTFVREARGVGGAPFLGSARGATTLTVFTDLACPYCAKLDARLREIAAAHPEVRVVLRHAPLPMHEGAPLAARAAIAADAQGKLAPFVARVFASQNDEGRAALVEHARREGLDVARFERDLDAEWTAARLAEDRALATKLGVSGTPTTFVEDERVVGAQPIATFERAIESAKKRPR